MSGPTITPPSTEDAFTENPFGEPLTREALYDIEMRHDFWNRKPQLQAIYHAAQHERISPWGLLGAVMAHQLSHVPPTVVLVKGSGDEGKTLAQGTSLNPFVGLVGKPGGGKSVTFRVASELVPPNGMPLPDGTGQGIVKCFADRKHVTKDDEGKPLDTPYVVTLFHRHSLVVHAPEVKTLNAEFAREGSKTAEMLRSMWVGETVGMTNADPSRAGNLPANLTRLCGIWGVQPQNAVAIMSGAGDGTPQRFLWVPVTERRRSLPHLLTNVGQPPPLTTFPLPLFGNTMPAIAMGTSLPKEVRDDASDDSLPSPIWVHWSPQMSLDAAQMQKEKDDFDAKYDEFAELPPEALAEEKRMNMAAHLLLMRIKLAAGLGTLWGNREPDDLDWYLSGALLEVSVGTAAGVWMRCESVKNDEAADRGRVRGVEMDAAVEERDAIRNKRIERIANGAYTKLAQRGPLREYQVKSSLAARDRASCRDALRHLEDSGRAEYDGTYWYAVYKGNKLTKNDLPTELSLRAAREKAAFEAAEAAEAAYMAGV